MELKNKFTIDQIAKRKVDNHHVPSIQMTANLLTKNVKKIKFKGILGLIELE